MTRQLATAVAIAALSLIPSVVRAQVPDTVGPGLRPPAGTFMRDTLRVRPPAPFVPAGSVAPPSPAVVGRAWADAVRARIAERQALRWRAAVTGTGIELPVYAPLVFDQPFEAPPRRSLSRYAELGMLINARFEMRLDRLKNLRCTAADASRLDTSCRAGFPPPRIEPQFSVRSGGLIGERISLNVDYDTEREFEASNNIQVYYQGLDDEMLRRIQVGNVTFAAPNSRFISGGIPANNFGAALEAQVGAVSLGAIFAQQKGNVVRGRVFTIGDRTLQSQDRDVMDRDFEPLRFFFVVDPAALPGWPAVDVLNLNGAVLADSVQVREARIYRRRNSTGRAGGEQNLGGIEAVALRPDSPQRAGSFRWELLVEGRDYYLDPSGAWFALAGRLDQDDYLAVSYVTQNGDTVGTFPGQATEIVDTLRLIYEPRRAADVPTFRYELRNVYRVGSVDDVVRESAGLRILVAESERPATESPTFLALLGVGQANNANAFDQYNRLFPRLQDPDRGAPLRDYYLVFPHLTPFGDSTKLAAEFRNDSLYRTPTAQLRTEGPTPLYRMRLTYDATGGDDRRVLSLGGFQIREGSERITAAGRELSRGTDYTMNYEIGQVTFLNPDSLFRQPTSVQVQYEENPAFAIAPTSIYGMQARYDLADHGSFSAVGLLQRQRTTYTRPPLGFEPSSNFVGGLTGNFRFEPNGLTRLLDGLPLLNTDARSTLTLDAEIAMSRPSPNQLGVAYVETFEEEGGTFIPLSEDSWEYGSRPSSALGLAGAGITAFDDADASLMVWQNFWASGGQRVEFRARQIDDRIRLQGAAEAVEPILWLTLHSDTIGGLWDSTFVGTDSAGIRPRWFLPHTPGPRWRSLSEPLSSTGVDLSRVEFLEFWVYEDSSRTARTHGVTVLFDFGTVFEDGAAFQPTGFTVNGRDTVFSGRRRAGEGRLDTERDTLTNAFNAGINDLGIMGDVADSIRNLDVDTLVSNMALCRSQLAGRLVVYPLGNDLARCTRRNGRADTEDLNNDQHLDSLISGAGESHFRYVFDMADDRYFVREGERTAGGATWRLYRIPFRADTIQIGTPDMRQVRSLRVTVVAPDLGLPERLLFLGLARMKLVGAPWVKRAAAPIAGIAGGLAQPHGEVIASVVSTENFSDLGYVPPPGVFDAGATRGGQFSAGATQINERSLRLLGSDVRPGERAEAFLRFSEGDRNFLGYRQMRVWARGRGPGWVERHLSFYVKVAQDENNFYLYRQALDTASWEPEAVVAFGRWLALRAAIEQAYLRGDPPSGAAACGAGDTLAYVACDGPYMVHVRNPGVAPPNLTRVQELAVGFVRDSGPALDSAELWVDDIRLSQVVDDAGYAGAITARLVAADVADLDLSLTRRDRNFRQLGEAPSYQTNSDLTAGATVRLERFGPERLGLAVPFSVRVTRSSRDPYYLNRTDVEAAGLAGLRRPTGTSASYSLALRRVRRGNEWWQRAFTDNVSLGTAWSSARNTTQLATSEARTFAARADYQVQVGTRTVGYTPRFLRGMLNGLPDFLRNTDMVRGLANGRLRWTPASLSLTTELARAASENTAFRAPIETPLDSLNRAVVVKSADLRTRAAIDLRPFSAAAMGVTLTSNRDLRDYGDSTTMGRVAGIGRRELLGADIGFERQRQLATRVSYNPALVSWLRPRWSLATGFSLSRDPNQSTPERELGDSGAFRLPTTFGNSRATEVGATIDWSRPMRALFGDSSVLRRVLDRVSQMDVSARSDRRSQFTRAGFDPALGYQLGWGGVAGVREQRGVLASAASEQRERRVTTGLRLPLGLNVTGSYVSLASSQWLLRGDIQQAMLSSDTDWPNLTTRWLFTPRGRAAAVLSSVNASLGLRRRLSETVQPALGEDPSAEGAVRGSQETRSRPFSLSLLWLRRVSTSFAVTNERVRTLRSGNTTVGDRGQVSGDVSFSFRIPPEYVPLRSDVRTVLRYLSSTNGSCIQRAGTDVCVPIAESRRTEYTLLLDTDMPPSASAGISVSQTITEDVHANRKFSQFVLTATVRVTFQAGDVR